MLPLGSPIALLPLQLSSTLKHASAVQTAVVMLLLQFVSLAETPSRHTNTMTYAHTDRVVLIQHPSIHSQQGHTCALQSHPALGSPLLGPTAVLGIALYTKQHRTGSKAERRANSLSQQFLVPTQDREAGCVSGSPVTIESYCISP